MEIRDRVMAGLARNRHPGLHFAGNFLGVRFEDAPAGEGRARFEPGAHCVETDGGTSLGALALAADMALAMSIRSNLSPESRLATVSMHLQLTGAPLAGAVEGDGRCEGFLEEARGRQGLARVSVRCGDRLALFGTGAFMALPPPAGVVMHPVARERPAGRLAESELDDAERRILRHADESIQRADAHHAFITHFWGTAAHTTDDGAECVMPNGAHVANRVGHVQGGLLVGLAAATARAALTPAWRLSAISAWFVGPGEGPALTARSSLVHRGKLTAVVRTEITGARMRRVLECVTAHALK
jgi:acyl-coenzyme A thioesterase PaaI-like protein